MIKNVWVMNWHCGSVETLHATSLKTSTLRFFCQIVLGSVEGVETPKLGISFLLFFWQWQHNEQGFFLPGELSIATPPIVLSYELCAFFWVTKKKKGIKICQKKLLYRNDLRKRSLNINIKSPIKHCQTGCRESKISANPNSDNSATVDAKS